MISGSIDHLHAGKRSLLGGSISGDIGAPRIHDLGLGVSCETEFSLNECLCSLLSSLLAHADHLVAHNLSPVGTVFVRMDDLLVMNRDQ